MTLDPFAGVPLYQQLADRLRAEIASGRLSGRVPSAKGLSQEFDVSVGTAERALALLREAGVIRSAIGRGHYVAPGGSGELDPELEERISQLTAAERDRLIARLLAMRESARRRRRAP